MGAGRLDLHVHRDAHLLCEFGRRGVGFCLCPVVLEGTSDQTRGEFGTAHSPMPLAIAVKDCEDLSKRIS